MNKIFNEYLYPEKNKKMNDISSDSKYIIRLYAPNATSDPLKNHLNLCDEFYRFSTDYCYAGHLITEYIYNPKSIFPESVERAVSTQPERDTFIFSVIFLYRHSIELLLKAILFKLMGNKDDCKNFIETSCTNKNSHSLIQLLNEIKARVSIPQNDAMLWLEEFLEGFSDIDWTSDSFRYPASLLKRKIFKKEIHVDGGKLVNKFESVFEIFEKWYLGDFTSNIVLYEKNPAVFEETDNYLEKAVVGSPCSNKSSFPQYESYLKCSIILRHYMKEHHENHDVASKLFHPMCYLFFNCTEISLKRMALDLFGVKKWKKHKIKNIWNKIRCYIDLFSKDENKEDLDTIEDYCYQISDFDGDSSKFRYPINKDMAYYFLESVTFDYNNVGTFMEAVNNALDYIYLDIKNKLEEDPDSYCEKLNSASIQ